MSQSRRFKRKSGEVLKGREPLMTVISAQWKFCVFWKAMKSKQTSS